MFVNLKMKKKLFVPITISTIIFIALITNIISGHYFKIESLKELNREILLSTYISKTLHSTQKERGLSSGYVINKDKQFKSKLAYQREITNRRLKKLREMSRYIKNKFIKGALKKSLHTIDTLTKQRDKIDELFVDYKEVIKFYSKFNNALLDIIIAISKESPIPKITQNIIAYSDFLFFKENVGLERAIGTIMLSEHTFGRDSVFQLTNIVSVQNIYKRMFIEYASPQIKKLYYKIIKNKDFLLTQNIRKTILCKELKEKFKINPRYWFDIITGKMDGLKLIDSSLEAEIIYNIEAELNTAYKYFILYIVLGIFSLVLFAFMVLITLNLIKSERRLKTIMDKYIISSITDTKGVIISASRAFCKISGYKESELLGHPHNIVRHPDMPKEAFRDMWSTIKKGRSWQGKVKNLKKDGSFYWVYVNIEPLFDYHGNIEAYVAIRLDITQSEILQIEMQKAIKQSKIKDQQLQQQSRLAQMGEMISMIAHQWRQPLTAISATSGAINLKAQLNKLDKDTAIELSSKISDYSQHLSSTIDDFRDFFKSNKEKRETSYDEIIQSVLGIIEISITNKNIKIVKELNSKDKFNSYPNELKQVVMNLIKNAEDILIEKSVQDPCIHIKTYKQEDKNILEISDNGGGIPKDILPKIFDPYFSTKTKKDGTGLGLYMSKTIIEEHCEGSMNAYNSKDGAVFKIVLEG